MRCKTAAEVARAIKTMVIRGAPAIGVAAAMGIALGMRRSKATGTQKFAAEFHKICELMAATRPTAVNLFWAIERMKRVVRRRRRRPASRSTRSRIGSIAKRDAIHDEDVASCRAMGAFGADVVPADARILTHCNAGALATAGYGTALGVIRGAVEAGQAGRGVRRRDAAVPAGRAADGVGAGARRHRDDGHHRQHGRRADAAGQGRSRRRRRRSHRRQRRHRQQDRHLQRRRARARARHSVLRRRAALDDRSRHAGRRAHSDRGAQRARGDARRRRRSSRRTARRSGTRRST